MLALYNELNSTELGICSKAVVSGQIDLKKKSLGWILIEVHVFRKSNCCQLDKLELIKMTKALMLILKTVTQPKSWNSTRNSDDLITAMQ